MLAWKYIFFISIFVFLYNYIGYAVIAYLFNLLRPKSKVTNIENYYPTVSFIVAAYNEGAIIQKKIENSLKQKYPSEKIEFIFITDGSSDDTPLIVSKFPQIKLLHSVERKGKSSALNRAAKIASNEILIISDANTFLNTNAVKYIAGHYNDQITGGVAGEKRVVQSEEDSDDVGNSEGLYWKYESILKRIDSDFYSVVGAAGELFSVRRELYTDISESTILDDFVISLKTASKGYRIIYEPRAYAMEFASASLKDEKKRKVRIAAGGFQSIQMLSYLFKFWNHPRLTFLYVSHRVLRWTVSPLCLVLIFISNVFLALKTQNIFYTFTFFLQVIFYAVSFASNYISTNSKLKFLKFTGYFVFMNLSVIQGFFRFISNKQGATWEKVNRSSAVVKVD